MGFVGGANSQVQHPVKPTNGSIIFRIRVDGCDGVYITHRPGRSKAGSRRSGRFVAPMTKTSAPALPPDRPSNSASNWLTMRSMTPPESPWLPRFGATESSSSKKITHGRASRARWNTRRTFASDSPMYMFNSSGPLTEKKFSAQEVATAFAISVFPVPGGP